MIVMPMPGDFGMASGHTRLMPIKERLEYGQAKLVLKALSASDRGLDYCVLHSTAAEANWGRTMSEMWEYPQDLSSSRWTRLQLALAGEGERLAGVQSLKAADHQGVKVSGGPACGARHCR